MITNIKLTINGESKSFPLLLNNYGILEAEELFPDFNITQIMTDFGLANKRLIEKAKVDKNAELDELNGIPKMSVMAKTIYAAHLGYCKTYKQENLSYEDFLSGMMNIQFQDIFAIFFKLIQASEKDKKKHSKKNSSE